MASHSASEDVAFVFLICLPAVQIVHLQTVHNCMLSCWHNSIMCIAKWLPIYLGLPYSIRRNLRMTMLDTKETQTFMGALYAKRKCKSSSKCTPRGLKILSIRVNVTHG